MKSLSAATEDFQADYIKTALYKFDGNLSEAAKALQISRRSIVYKVERYELGDFAARLREKAGVSGPRH
jgi:transcriptional regulator with PAS, ATPase and Fis domain